MKLLISVALFALAAFAADNSLGTWKLDAAKSKYGPGPMPVKSLSAVREAADGGVKVTNTGSRTDGTDINATYTVKFDGTPATVTGSGAPYDTISIKQVNPNTFTDVRKKTGGPYHATGRLVVSEDGKTITWTSKGMDADGKPFSSTFIYDKQ